MSARPAWNSRSATASSLRDSTIAPSRCRERPQRFEQHAGHRVIVSRPTRRCSSVGREAELRARARDIRSHPRRGAHVARYDRAQHERGDRNPEAQRGRDRGPDRGDHVVPPTNTRGSVGMRPNRAIHALPIALSTAPITTTTSPGAER